MSHGRSFSARSEPSSEGRRYGVPRSVEPTPWKLLGGFAYSPGLLPMIVGGREKREAEVTDVRRDLGGSFVWSTAWAARVGVSPFTFSSCWILLLVRRRTPSRHIM